MSDLVWMQKAYNLALIAEKEGEVPVGAVVVDDSNHMIGQGYNSAINKNDPTAHAEILAIRDAANNSNNYRLLNSTLYVTLEPCLMCIGALVHARVKRLVFATRDWKVGAAGSVFNYTQGYPLNHRIQVDDGLMQEDCSRLLSGFFQKNRVDS